MGCSGSKSQELKIRLKPTTGSQPNRRTSWSLAGVQPSVPAAGLSSEPQSAQCILVLNDANLLTMISIVASSTGLHRAPKIFMMEACNTTIGEIARQNRDELCACLRQGIRQLFSTGKDRKATEILVDHVMLVSPLALRRRMLQGRQFEFERSGKLGNWFLNCCRICKLPPSFGALVCSEHLNLVTNRLESLPDSFSEIIVAGCLYLNDNKLESVPERFSDITLGQNLMLGGNPQLTGVPQNFPNVKGTVFR